jgi:hypothetical protein
MRGMMWLNKKAFIAVSREGGDIFWQVGLTYVRKGVETSYTWNDQLSLVSCSDYYR